MLTALRRLRAWLRRDALDERLREEIQDHLARRARAFEAAGLPPGEASAAARRLFGNVLRLREESREMWGFPKFESILQDLRFGARLLRRAPAFTTVAVISLAVGIGAVTAVFGLADAVLFKSLPVRDPGSLVILRWVSGPTFAFDSLSGYASQGETENSSTSFSLAAFVAGRDRGTAVADVIGFAGLDRLNLGIQRQAEIAAGAAVSGNYFDVLGVPPAAGRLLGAADDTPAAAAAAMISHTLWQRRFAGSQDAVGRPLSLNGVPVTIVGVTPAGFRGTLQVANAPDVFVPLSLVPQLERSTVHTDPAYWWVLMIGRLKPGVSVADAQAGLGSIISANIAENRPALAAKDVPRVVLESGARGQREDRDQAREPILMMASVVAIVLLVACANVASLLLARAATRSREISMRVALGARRSRVARQLLTEGLLLAVLGAALGLAFARPLAIALVPALDTHDLSHIPVTIDWRVAMFAAALATLATLFFGLLPAVRATRVDLVPGGQAAGARQVGSVRRFGLTGALVSLQVALSLLLLSGAALLVGSVRNLETVDPGFDPSNLLVFRVDPSLNGYDGDRLRSFYASLLARVRVLPGVSTATLSSHTLLSNSAAISRVHLPGAPPAASASGQPERVLAWRLAVDDEFFRTMGMPLLQGRGFDPGDSPTSQPIAIVNTRFVRDALGGDTPIGRRFRLSDRPGAVEYEVVGVVPDTKYSSIRAAAPMTVYLSERQDTPPAATITVRAAGDPGALTPAIRAAVAELDPAVPLMNLRTQSEQIAASLARERMFARLASVLGTIALLLSAIGLYGLLMGAVSRRVPEIGLRMALGADRRDVTLMVLRHSMVLIAAGIAAGLPAALYGTRVIDSLLFGLVPTDPRALAAAIALLLATAALAAWIPARRAARVDPAVALRN